MMCSCIPSVFILFCSGKTESVGGEGVHSELFEKKIMWRLNTKSSLKHNRLFTAKIISTQKWHPCQVIN